MYTLMEVFVLFLQWRENVMDGNPCAGDVLCDRGVYGEGYKLCDGQQQIQLHLSLTVKLL